MACKLNTVCQAILNILFRLLYALLVDLDGLNDQLVLNLFDALLERIFGVACLYGDLAATDGRASVDLGDDIMHSATGDTHPSLQGLEGRVHAAKDRDNTAIASGIGVALAAIGDECGMQVND